jgi:hypothetical protein
MAESWDLRQNRAVMECSTSFNGFYGVAVAVERQRAMHTENSGFASPTLGQHISTFRGYQNDVIGLVLCENCKSKQMTEQMSR